MLGYAFNQTTYEVLITRSTALGGTANAAEVLWKEMQSGGFAKPSSTALAALVEVNFREKRYDAARDHFIWMISAGMKPNALTLLQAYAIEESGGREARAAELLRAMKVADGWPLLLAGLAQLQSAGKVTARKQSTATKKRGKALSSGHVH